MCASENVRACERDCESVFVDDGLSECLRECFYESGSSFTLLLSADVLSKGAAGFLGIHTYTVNRAHFRASESVPDRGQCA